MIEDEIHNDKETLRNFLSTQLRIFPNFNSQENHEEYQIYMKNLIRLSKRAIEISSIRLGDKELNSIRQAVDLIRKINAESLGSGIE